MSKRKATESRRAIKFRVFSDEHRLKIIELLYNGERSVKEIAESLGLAQNLTSHHLAALKQAGILDSTKAGRTVTYRLACGTTQKKNEKVLELDCCTVILK